MPQGTTIVDFGAFPGASDASGTITGQGSILTTSNLGAWLISQDSVDHSADEHATETIEIVAGNIVAATSFTIYARNSNQINEPLESPGVSTFRTAAGTVYGYAGPSVGGMGTRLYGKWNVGWAWL